jgi:predicted nuclease of predicted toxin-antitoxin system
MKFLVDAQLPRSLARWLNQAGYEAIHTLDLPQGNRTPDGTINELATNLGYIVVTKDADFVNSHLVLQQPPKLLLISTGNTNNQELMILFSSSMKLINEGFGSHDFLEMSSTSLIFHK